MKAIEGLEGSIIENWKVGKAYSKIYGNGNKRRMYHCECIKCGHEKEISSSDLNRRIHLECVKCNGKKSSYKDDKLEGTKQGTLYIGKPFRKNDKTYYHVLCDCGREYDILRDNLIRKKYKNCKCHGMAVDKTKKYGMLQPLERMGDGNWKCLCDCGNITYKSPSYLMREGMNFSCGCKKKADRIKKRTDNKTGVKGVCFVTSKQKYLAYITKNGYTYRCGFHDTIEEASVARFNKEKELFAENKKEQEREKVREELRDDVSDF